MSNPTGDALRAYVAHDRNRADTDQGLKVKLLARLKITKQWTTQQSTGLNPKNQGADVYGEEFGSDLGVNCLMNASAPHLKEL